MFIFFITQFILNFLLKYCENQATKTYWLKRDNKSGCLQALTRFFITEITTTNDPPQIISKVDLILEPMSIQSQNSMY